jgi:cysteinyl-tRNA synthetase
MAIQIYNSLSKKKEDFIPQEEGKVKLYSCGVTVYDKCHIGHARSLYIFDVIRKYLQYRDYDVLFVRNITDIDDKIINKAKELNKPAKEVSEDNIKLYYEDLDRLGIDRADIEPKATDNIEGMISHIEKLINDGYAYESQGDVYFNVRKFETYGKLSGQSIEHMLEAVRIDQQEKKKDPLDFALWKKSQEGDPFWESPWGDGRPGWHIECSCMSMKHLGCETLDIHAGGRDLIFPHHENEIAQSEAFTGKLFAKYWIHHGLLTIEKQKMAKSAGNFITIEDALAKYSVDQLKMFYLSSHYASPIDFTEIKMEEAYKALQKFDILFWKAHDIIGDQKNITPKKEEFIQKHEDNFLKAMDDDFNTPKALATLFDLINDTNKFIDQNKDRDDYSDVVFCAVSALENFSKNILGLFKKEESKDLSKEDQKLLDARLEARVNKDWARSDEIRDELKEKGIIVEDGKEGQTWRWA